MSKRIRFSGQALVEYALSIPFLLLVVLAIVYFGKAFYISQSITFAAQEGACLASRVPNLKDVAIRDYLRGFSSDGVGINPDSVIYSTLGSAHLLSQGLTGNLPAKAKVKILPWDSDGSPEDYIPAGTVAVRIEYPFQLLANPFAASTDAPELTVALAAPGQGDPVPLPNMVISQKATASQEVFQEVN